MRRCFTALLIVACGRTDGGGVAAGPSVDAPAAVDAGAGGAPLSAPEWLALTGPQPGVHEVYTSACGGERVAQDYRIRPIFSCGPLRTGSRNAAFTRDCAIEDYCTSADDCTAQRAGVCRGNASSSCEYSGFVAEAPCERDTDCNAAPAGACEPSFEAGTEYCYSTGECRIAPLQSCSYPGLSEPCESDADCTTAPGGSCQHAIRFTECAYNECEGADDCGPAARCECQGVRRCVPASCFADTDCAAGYRCEASLAVQCGNLRPAVGYHCHAAVDECSVDTDCDGLSCVFDPDVAHWACRDVRCFDR